MFDFSSVEVPASTEDPKKKKFDFSTVEAPKDFSGITTEVSNPLDHQSLIQKAKAYIEEPNIYFKNIAHAVLGENNLGVLREASPTVYGFGQAAAQLGEGMTSIENAALLMASAAKLPKLVTQIASGGFSAMMAKDLPELQKKYNTALKSGDKRESARLGGLLLGQGLFTFLGLTHAGGFEGVKGGVGRVATPEELGIKSNLQIKEGLPSQENLLTFGGDAQSRNKSPGVIRSEVPIELGAPWPKNAGAVINPLEALNTLIQIGKDSKTYAEFREKVSKNIDLMDTARAYNLNLLSVYDKRNDAETQNSISSFTDQGKVKPKLTEGDVDLAYQQGVDHIVENTGSYNPDLVPGVREANSAPVRNVGDFLYETQKPIPLTKDIQFDFENLKTKAAADEMQAKKVLENTEFTPKDMEQVYHNRENPAEPLSPEQQKLKATIEPLSQMREQEALKLKDAGVLLPPETYAPRFPANKGGVFDRMAQGINSLGIRSGLLSRTTGNLKHRVMQALVDEQGNRQVVAIKGDGVTGFAGKKPVALGNLNLKSYQDLMDFQLKPILRETKNLQNELRTLTATKGRQEASPVRIGNIQNRLDFLDIERQKIEDKYSPFKLEGKVFIDKNKKRWTVEQATTKEVEANTNQTYHKNLLMNELITYLKLRKANRAVEFLESLKTHPDFTQVSMKLGSGNTPPDWRTTDLPQFRGYAFDPHMADVLDKFHRELKSGGDPGGIYDKVNNFLREAIFFNFLIHPPNIIGHAIVERGVKAYVTPSAYKNLLTSSWKAARAVFTQNEDYVKMLDSNVNLLYHKYAGEKLIDLMEKKYLGELEKSPELLDSVSKALGYASGLNLLKGLYKFSGKVTWATNDFAMLRAIYEGMENGKTQAEAIKDVAKHIPDYRVPARVLGMTELSKLMTNSSLTMFGRYHYGALKSYGEMLKSAAGLIPGTKTPFKEGLDSMDKMAMMALFGTVVMPVMDELAKALTGHKNEVFRRAGPLTFPHHTIRFIQGKEDLGQYLQSVITPAVGLNMAMGIWHNRDMFTGRKLIHHGTVVADFIKTAAAHIAPVEQARKIMAGKLKPEDAFYNLLSMKQEK